MTISVLRFSVVLALAGALGTHIAYAADCSTLAGLAQQHANDMARRNSLDHAGFMRDRGPRGAIAENVAVGCDSEACAKRMWMNSPHHRANMMLGGCQAVASAVSASGRRYWAMEIGGGGGVVVDRKGRKRHARLVNNFTGAHRDMSVEGENAPN